MAKVFPTDVKQTWQTCNFCSWQTFKSSSEFLRYIAKNFTIQFLFHAMTIELISTFITQA